MGAAREPGYPPLWAAWYGVGVLAVATIVSTVNNIIINLTTDPIKQSIGLSDTQIGAIGGLGMTLMAAVAAYPMGWLADRMDRRVLMFVCVGLWSLATIAFGLSHSFGALMGWAVLMSVSEAVLGPMTYSMIPDLFPRDKWVVANYVFFLSALLGWSMGLGASGALVGWVEANRTALPFGLAAAETWRGALILSTITGPVLMAAVLLIPLRRRIIDVAASSTAGMIDFIRSNARSLFGVFFGFGISYAALGTMRGWIAPALMRTFGETPAEVGAVLGWSTMLAAVGGVGCGWMLTQVLQKRFGAVTNMRVAQIGIAGGCISALVMPFAASAAQLYAVSAFGLGLIMMAMSLSPAILQFLSPAHMRGRVIALGGLITLLFGSLSPVAVGLFSDNVFHGPTQLLWAMSAVATPSLLVGLLIMLYGTKTLPDTIEDAALRS